VLLDAFVGLDRDVELWVAGDGPQTESLRSRAIAGVVWLGRVSEAEKAARLAASAIACFPAIEGESFGVVLLEAMAAGAPVVASDIDGYRGVARAGVEGLLVPPGDVGALRRALRTLLDDPARRATFAAAGRARAEEFSMTCLAERFLELYERAIAVGAHAVDRAS